MEGGEGSGFDGAHMRRRRSSAARRPRPEGGPAADQRDNAPSPPSPSASSRSGPRRLLLSSDENAAGPDGGNRRREFLLNAPSSERATKGSIRLRSDAAGGGTRKTEGASHGAQPEGNRGSSPAGGKPGKVKLKIRNVLLKPNPDAADSRSLQAKPPRPVDSRHQLKTESAKDSDRSTSSRDKKTRKERSIEEAMAQEQSAKVQREPSSDPVRKSRRLAKKSVLDNEIDEDYDTSNVGTPEDWDGNALELKNKGGSSSKKNFSKKAKNRSKAYEVDNEFVTSRSSRDGKKRSRESADDDNTEEELTSYSEPEAEDEQKTVTESPVNVRSEPLTTRRRALQSWMDGSSSSTVEFPDGLPLAPSRSKKDKLSEEEMLAKKAEAAQRRRMQVEKATKESEAEAIRKILGLDSEKKKEERKQKEREEKERATRAQNIAASSIRWVMGPTRTIVSFPHAVGLPSIFNSKPHSYPPPREKCAGPSCTNEYKYRHSKLNLPLCSLKCYKAVQENA
ncbi:hypothetical protein SEVIR_3G349600v4 [Setaria viridis]|uniref:INO80 complex subunit B-like conserved region domain-containing protein n=2 Tax=Setaria TaxID=4554 RepID=K3Z5J0_SETIT|nr:eukaryotic translation initiation factor 5B isoform X2 [Setaria italica]XP_034588243.1 eukaryotic translation initiation factor 5B-like isoform X2 [Setaria viridis]RCV18836.1 hypothetical protein SETIT_3G335200v2 [Setaria italica]TKW28773.1 hypothetical protein SEVIR_3G349600v2 [Setaria viridis]TKW28774.1 hypothetical protein SEVIR_3G349600v2 [Setaria viridis]